MTTPSESTTARPFAAKAFECLRKVVQLFPAATVLWIAGNIGVLAQFFCSRERKISIAQIQFALGKSEDEARALTAELFRHIGMFVGEVLLLEKLLKSFERPSSRIELNEEGGDLLDSLKDKGESVVLLSGHVGNFELLAAYHHLRNRPVAGVGRHANYKILDDILKDFRASFNYKMFWRDDSRAMGKILRELKKGVFYGGFLDQDTDLDNSFSPFFGLAAASPSVPIQLAVKYGYPVVTTFCVREAPLKYKLVSETLEYDSSAGDVADRILEEYNKRVEALVRKYPEQWPWWHRRWRRRPEVNYRKDPDALRSSREYLAWLAEQTTARV